MSDAKGVTPSWYAVDRVLLDPTIAGPDSLRRGVDFPPSLQGQTIALLDIGKMRGNEFIDQLEQSLNSMGYETRRYAKPTNVKVAPVALLQRIALEANVVVEALADCGSCTSCAIHDLNELDLRHIPGLLIATDEFQDAARAQSGALGFAPGVIWVPHPIQNRTRKELHLMARQALPNILESLQRPKEY